MKKARKGKGEKVAGAKKGKTFVLGGVNSKMLTTFTRQLAILQEAGLPILRHHGRGCQICNNTGFKGRTGLYEFMLMNDQLRELIQRGSSTEQLRDIALQTGMRSLRKAGLEKVFTGVTSIEEVIRETVHE